MKHTRMYNDTWHNTVGLFQIATVWIIAVTIGISVSASISGAHLNPAITVMFAMFRKFPWSKVIPYGLAQVLGAMIGSWLNYILYASVFREYEAKEGIVRESDAGRITASCFGDYYLEPVTTAQAFLAEALGTAVLGGVVMAVTHPRNSGLDGCVPLLIGLTVGGLVCVLAPLTQAGINPARDFGPRLVAYAMGWSADIAFQNCWVYIVAPIVGAAIGGCFIDKVLFATPEGDKMEE
jgi:glycerol uptake facilitator protein